MCTEKKSKKKPTEIFFLSFLFFVMEYWNKNNNKQSYLDPSLSIMKDSKQLLHYVEEAMELDYYSYDSDADGVLGYCF